MTFDCGYENGFTPKILDVLKRQKVVAAFFVTKPFIREEAKLVKRMKKEGHIVGNHTVHHKSMPTLSDRDNKTGNHRFVHSIVKKQQDMIWILLSDLQWESIMREHYH